MMAFALFVDKPAGPTSFMVLKQLRRQFGFTKIGHCGTLDPEATGVLIVLLGDATKFQRFVADREKSYSGVIRIGVTTDTDDLTGTILSEKPVPEISPAKLEELRERFSGAQSQLPPQFSAVKLGGKRAYELARKGQSSELSPRDVVAHKLELELLESNRLAYRLTCSKGFYVRSLARDIGEFLECGGAAESIRRVSTCGIDIEQAIPLDELLALPIEQLPLRTVREILCTMPAVECSDAEYKLLLQGRGDAVSSVGRRSDEASELLLVLEDRNVAGMLTAPDSGGRRGVEFLIPGLGER